MLYCLTWVRKKKGRDEFSLYPWKGDVPGSNLEGVEGVTVLNEGALNFSIQPDASVDSLRGLFEHIQPKPIVRVRGRIPDSWKPVVRQFA